MGTGPWRECCCNPFSLRNRFPIVTSNCQPSTPTNCTKCDSAKFLQQFSYREIAEVMGLSESHVGVLLHQAIKTLRATFAA